LASMLELLLRLAISMGVVMAVMYLAARYARRRQGMSGRRRSAKPRYSLFGQGGMRQITAKTAVPPSGRLPKGLFGRPRVEADEPPAQVVCRLPLSKGAWGIVVEASGRMFLLGVTDQRVELVAELGKTEQALELEEETSPKGLLLDERPDNAWKLALDSLRERTVRR
jgi:Flagellar biosynthesis protein, FliO